MIAYPEISKRVHDKYHNLEHDEMVKSIFNSRKNKAGVGIKILSWMITDEMKLTENYRLYAKVFGVDVPTTQSQPIESTQETHRTTSTPRSPNPDKDEGESRAQRKYTVIRLCILPRRSTRLTPPTLILTALDVEDMIVQDTIKLSLAEQKSHDDLKAEQNVEKVKEHLTAEEIEKMVEGTENVEDKFVNSVLNNQNDPDTRLDPGSYKESLEVEKTDVVQPVNVIETEEESAEDDYKLRRRIKFKGLTTTNTPCRFSASRPRDQDDHQDDAHLEEENSANRQKITEHGTYVFRESSSGPANESEPGPSTIGNQEQLDDFDFCTDKYATDDDELPAEKVSQELVEEMSEIIDEAKLRKVVDEMLKQRCTSGDEHQYHIDQMQNFSKNDMRSKKYMLSLHKFYTVIFPDDDIKERTSRWVDKCVKKFNPYARYSVEHWKHTHAKIFYIKRQKELENPIEEVYSDSKIVQVIKTIGELRHEHKFVIEIIIRRANGGFSSITELDYMYLNKNNIKDMYLLCVNGKEDDYAKTRLLWSLSVCIRSIVIWDIIHDLQLGVESYQQNVNLIAPIITFLGIEKKKMFFIITEPIYGIIYKNNKKEKRVMGHQEIHKFRDATLKRVLEWLKSYNNDVKHGYVTPSLSKEYHEYLRMFKEEIEERLKHRNQMRRWEMYVNGRPLVTRRERPG
uniref:Uncharacterized protein n=1 Tax=Tanacetum cinerariifolium TaxID=118510 RepID=A0A6L2KPY2_TANCI|nr:hypothetical protein [Tanacetum cinerariifolium]